jgi:hypothetical protein
VAHRRGAPRLAPGAGDPHQARILCEVKRPKAKGKSVDQSLSIKSVKTVPTSLLTLTFAFFSIVRERSCV